MTMKKKEDNYLIYYSKYIKKSLSRVRVKRISRIFSEDSNLVFHKITFYRNVIVFDNVTLTIVAINNNFDFRNRNIDYSSSR